MYQKIKDTLSNIRRHYILFSLLALSLFVSYRLFFHFYQLQVPYIERTAVNDTISTRNDYVVCAEQLDAMRTARAEANADIMR